MAKRVLSAEINHETNTFNRHPTTRDLFICRRLLKGPEIKTALAGTNTEISAHLAAAKEFGWDLVQPLAAQATPGGPSSAETWAELSGLVIDAAVQGPYDGVLLALHGAMVTENHDDAEVELITRLREVLGPDVPIAVTFDLHGNIGMKLADLANIVIAYRSYPHVDMFDRGMEAAGLLQRAMAGEIRPRLAVAKRPMIEGCDYGRSGGPVMSRILARAEELRRGHPDILAVAVCAGFPWADIPEVGPSVTVTCDASLKKGRELAEALMDEVWELRHEHSVPLLSLDEAMARAQAATDDPNQGPLVLSDFTDNPGSGGYGDGVRLLEAMIAAKLPRAALAAIADPKAVQVCEAAGVGATLETSLGACIDPEMYGPPLLVRGEVINLSDGDLILDGPMNAGVKVHLGPTAVLRIGGVEVIVATNNMQIYDRQFFLSQGIDPQRYPVVALKSWHHFRAAFEPIARDVLLVDSGGLASMDLARFTYNKVKRPVFPLDMD
ncbi:MAG: M81 family metallopeptidase [Desulfarculaceae bacterium]|jgi:microcystin degradation protein MlrC